VIARARQMVKPGWRKGKMKAELLVSSTMASSVSPISSALWKAARRTSLVLPQAIAPVASMPIALNPAGVGMLPQRSAS